ncbi:LysR family transcriptional regulator [Massilia sp. TSP1-1-2]|uniref:LysR family transcriptional regulator n=1 Tax=Massilia sp. TSP1-1-2 TaxID=2804649 RepID=UPI003CF0C1C1
MSTPDLNQLITLDAVLAEGSVAGAARRLRLSPSAMSRALARLRESTGDPLLVRVGRAMVLTPRALALRVQVSELVQEAKVVLRPEARLDLRQLVRTFTLRTRDGFAENFGPALIERVGEQAPGVHLRFVQKPDKDGAALRDGAADLETGVIDNTTEAHMRTRALFSDRFIGVVRAGHPLCQGKLSAARYAQGRHVGLSMGGQYKGAVDAALAALGLARDVVATVGGFSSALALARGSDLVATVPTRHTGMLRDGMHSFALPVDLPDMTVSLLWHPRLDADQAHRWLRALLADCCAAPLTPAPPTFP